MAQELGMEFLAKLSWDDDISPLGDKEAVRRAVGLDAATRAEFRERHGHDYVQGICHQLWDSPQINWDGKVLGCCRNFWGDFGGNAFRDGLIASLNNEKIAYARSMLRGRSPARDDVPCTTCEIYIGMQNSGRWLDRDDAARGQTLTVEEAFDIAAEWQKKGRTADAASVYHRILQAQPGHAEAQRRLNILNAAMKK
jgi:hypothetical protein